MISFSLFVNGKQYPNEGLSMDMTDEKSSVLAYNTLFEGSGSLIRTPDYDNSRYVY
jgi:hypothetical protein